MRFLILGGGLQGSACAYDLLRQDDVDGVTIADLVHRDVDFLPDDDDRLIRRTVDFTDEPAVRDLMEANDVALSAAPYYLNADLARWAVASGCDYSDLGGNTEIVFEQLDLGPAAEEAGCTLIPDVGLAPGLVNVLAVEGARRLDEAEEVMMYVGGLPQRPHPPLDYQVVYSLEGTLDYYTTPSWIVRNGERLQVEALSEVEQLEFEGLGTLEAFHTGGGASTLPWHYEGEVDRLAYKTLRYPGHADLMRSIRELGLLSQEEIELDGARVAPRDLFMACVAPHLKRPDEPDLVVLKVVARGWRGDMATTLTWDLLDLEDPSTGITAM
ncbi:MAG: saccharopine dehydrogenase family protein [Gemmatimonadota bacterium]